MTRTLLFLLGVVLISSGNLLAQLDSSKTEDSVKEFDENLLEQSTENSPVIDEMTEAPASHPGFAFALRARLSQKLRMPRGYADGTFRGTPIASYDRMTVTSGKVSGGVLFTKDPGEQRVNDFTSWNLGVMEIGVLRKAVVGSYRIEAGQGVALWRGYDFLKGAEVIAPVNKKPRGIVAALSSDETAYFNGGAMEIGIGPVTTMAFFSRRKLSVSRDSLDEATSVSSSGYFRTESEQFRRDNFTEVLSGVTVRYDLSDQGHLGVTYYRSMFSSPLVLDEGKRFVGKQASLFALEYRTGFRVMTLFGEWAGGNSAIGGTSGVRIDPDERVTLLAAVRNYPYRFVSLHGLGFGENSSMSNEAGVYFGARLKPARSLTISFYYDQFSFPQKTSVSNFSSGGRDILAELHGLVFRKCHATIRYQRKITDQRPSSSNVFTDLQRVQRFRVQIDYDVATTVRLRGRIERMFLDWQNSSEAEKGLMLYQDLSVRSGARFWWNLRVAFFQTGSYSTRLYAYEDDLDGALAMPPLYGTGIRWYCVLRYRCGNSMVVMAKYSDLIRDDVRHIGSGVDELPANHDNRLGIQLDVSY